MPALHACLPLPDHGTARSARRRVGVEVEFAGLDVPAAAEVIADACGGRLDGPDTGAPRESIREIHVRGSRLGDIRVELDIALKRQWAEDLAASVLGDLIPVEVITEPLPRADLPRVESLLRTLAAAGALGTHEKLAYGFGIHFNIELPDDDGAALVATARAYALCEDWMRRADPLDPARRVLPFVAAFPHGLVAELARAEGWAPTDLARAMATHAPSRNFGLDLLPALQHLCPDALSGVPEDHLKGARPAFHYRLPEARLGAPGWSLAYEWNRWSVIEHVATDPDLLAALAADWPAHQGPLPGARATWAARVEARIAASALPARMGLDLRAPASDSG
ncbi:MAG: amidoligase family protein [Rhodobacteraceae bacterium]|nr:amidoligase family protein [Paracoccaceae bacterium]